MPSLPIATSRLRWRRLLSATAVAALALLLAAWAAPSATTRSRSRRPASTHTACGAQPLPICLATLLGPSQSLPCHSAPLTPAANLPDVAGRLAQLIERVPCPATGRASYHTFDADDNAMGVLDPIQDPAGGYLGVYHTALGSPAGATATEFQVSLAHSNDLIHWSPIRVLDPTGATMPTLREVPASGGYLLAYEKDQPPIQTRMRVRYYRSLAALLAGEFAVQRDLPRRFSAFSNGTPSILSVAWHGGLRRSVIELGFHYNQATGPILGPDREALGLLRGFRHWTARRDPRIDALLIGAGFPGSHGDRRQFEFDGRPWRIYEAQARLGSYASWHLVLVDPISGQAYPLTMTTDTGAHAASFGNPTAQVEPAPGGTGQVLVLTMFVFGAGGEGGDRGELVYYQPL